jgi:hypothetical protein
MSQNGTISTKDQFRLLSEEWKVLHRQLMVIRKAKQLWPTNLAAAIDVDHHDRDFLELLSLAGSGIYIPLDPDSVTNKFFQKVRVSFQEDPQFCQARSSFPENPDELLSQFCLDNYEKLRRYCISSICLRNNMMVFTIFEPFSFSASQLRDLVMQDTFLDIPEYFKVINCKILCSWR